MSQAKFFVVYDGATDDGDQALAELFCNQLGRAGFDAEVKDIRYIKEGTPGFHFLFASSVEDHFNLCWLAIGLELHSSALNEREILALKHYALDKLEATDTDDLGSDVYVVFNPDYSDSPDLLPMLRSIASYNFVQTKDGLVADSWSYGPLPANTELYSTSLREVRVLMEKIQCTKPLVIGVQVNNDGAPSVVEVIPNFGLSEHSLVPTALALNGVNLSNFLKRAYDIPA
jgi:hypothetical protein